MDAEAGLANAVVIYRWEEVKGLFDHGDGEGELVEEVRVLR